jgi:hypothetical protein
LEWTWRFWRWDLSKFKNLKKLDIDLYGLPGPMREATLKALSSLKTLTYVQCPVDAYDTGMWEEALSSLPNLTELHMGRSIARAAHTIWKRLHLPTVKKLWLPSSLMPHPPTREQFPNVQLILCPAISHIVSMMSSVDYRISPFRDSFAYNMSCEIASARATPRGLATGFETALMAACRGEYPRAALDLLQLRNLPAPFSINVVDPLSKRSAFGLACANRGWVAVVSAMLKAGADVNHVFPDGRTPLSLFVVLLLYLIAWHRIINCLTFFAAFFHFSTVQGLCMW